MMRFLSMIIILSGILYSGCKYSEKEPPDPLQSGSRQAGYARKFIIDTREVYTKLSVFDPWQQAQGSRFDYIVTERIMDLPDSLKSFMVIERPVERIVLMSTTFVPFVDTLGALETVAGISGGDLVYDPRLRERISEGDVREVGFDQRLNYELLLKLKPDVVFLFGVQPGIVQTVSKLKDIGIPAVLCADYLEPHPLGRAEWLRFFSVFFGREKLADSIFSDIARRYTELADSLVRRSDKPMVMMGLPWKDIWYVAGGKSFAAALVRDAGGKYIFSDIDSEEAVPIDIEAVFSRCYDADIWINPGIANSFSTILEHDPRFDLLPPFIEGNVYSNGKRMSKGGGNDYWESGILHPDRILRDLSSIFYQSAETDTLYYYYKLPKRIDSN